MRSTAIESFNDTCQIGVYGVTTGTYSKPAYTYGAIIACGFTAKGGRETADGTQTALNSGSLRLPVGTAITSKDRIKLISRFGTTLSTAIEFRILGAPEHGPTAITLQLQAITAQGTG